MAETKNDLQNSPEEFNSLSSEEQEQLTHWIRHNLDPIKSFNDRHTSYGLKHIFTSNGGFYISNGAFKGAMLRCGFKVKDKTSLNWVFNVSEQSLKRIIK